MLIVVVSVTTIMSQRTAELFAKLASPGNIYREAMRATTCLGKNIAMIVRKT